MPESPLDPSRVWAVQVVLDQGGEREGAVALAVFVDLAYLLRVAALVPCIPCKQHTPLRTRAKRRNPRGKPVQVQALSK